MVRADSPLNDCPGDNRRHMPSREDPGHGSRFELSPSTRNRKSCAASEPRWVPLPFPAWPHTGRSIDPDRPRLGGGLSPRPCVRGDGSVVFGVAMVTLVVTVQAEWPLWSSYAAAAVAGATLPPIDACVRTRWAHVLDDANEAETAYAFEAVVDEVVFMVGPIVVTLLATLVAPGAGIAATVVAGVGGSLAFAAQRTTDPPAHPADPSAGSRTPVPWRRMSPTARGTSEAVVDGTPPRTRWAGPTGDACAASRPRRASLTTRRAWGAVQSRRSWAQLHVVRGRGA